MQHSESIKAIAGALLKFQGSVSGVHRDGKNPAFKSRYATLENVIDTARPALQEVGLVFVQAPGAIVDGALEVTTQFFHVESGEWMRSTMHIVLGKRDPQGTGSALTYALRYSLMAMLGLPPTDDDGEAAMERGTSQPIVAAPARTSSSALKRDDVWAAMEHDISECRSTASLQKLRATWGQKALRDKWPVAWFDAAAETFDKAEAALGEAPDDDIFPGDKPTSGNKYADNYKAG